MNINTTFAFIDLRTKSKNYYKVPEWLLLGVGQPTLFDPFVYLFFFTLFIVLRWKCQNASERLVEVNETKRKYVIATNSFEF